MPCFVSSLANILKSRTSLILATTRSMHVRPLRVSALSDSDICFLQVAESLAGEASRKRPLGVARTVRELSRTCILPCVPVKLVAESKNILTIIDGFGVHVVVCESVPSNFLPFGPGTTVVCIWIYGYSSTWCKLAPHLYILWIHQFN